MTPKIFIYYLENGRWRAGIEASAKTHLSCKEINEVLKSQSSHCYLGGCSYQPQGSDCRTQGSSGRRESRELCLFPQVLMPRTAFLAVGSRPNLTQSGEESLWPSNCSLCLEALSVNGFSLAGFPNFEPLFGNKIEKEV